MQLLKNIDRKLATLLFKPKLVEIVKEVPEDAHEIDAYLEKIRSSNGIMKNYRRMFYSANHSLARLSEKKPVYIKIEQDDFAVQTSTLQAKFYQ